MNPIKFPEVTVIWAENQPEYLPLPAYTNEKETISCWRLTWLERIKALLGYPLWLRQYNFGESLQPQAPTFEYPFIKDEHK